MPVIAKNEGKSFEQPTVGVVQAACAFVEDIGTHQSEYNGKPIKRHQIVVCWELSEKMKEGDYAGKPFMMSKFYTLSLNEKATLRKDLESWRGVSFTQNELAGFDVEKLIGANCLLNLVSAQKRDGSDTIKIAAIMPLPRNTTKINAVNTVPPKWIEEFRRKSLEAASGQGNDEPPINNDELPF